MQDESKQIGKIFDGKTLQDLFVFAKPYMGFFYLLIFLTIFLTILSTARPFLIQYTIDHYVLKGNMNALLSMMGFLVGLIVLQAITEYSNSYLSDWLGQTIIKDIRIKLFRHLMTFRLKFYDSTPIGRLITRNISDVESLADVFSEGIAAMTGDLLQVLSILGIMLYLDWKLTLVSLASFPFLLLATYIFKESIKVSFNDVRLAVAKLNTFVQEHITGMSVVQIFNSEKREYKKFLKINEEHRDANLKSVLAYSIYFPVVEVISAVGTGMCIWYGSMGILDGFTTEGTLVAFILYLSMFFRPIRQIADRFNTLQMGIVSAHRLLNLLNDNEPMQHSGKQSLQNLKGKVEFKNVWFSYNEGQDVLKNISFTAEPGQTIALVGATGAGKSSIINILNRFYEINRGEVLIDGINISQLDLAELRQHIGLVLQDVFLFSGSIADNITLNDPNITREQLEATAELVGASEFIRKMPNGFDYEVMERGATLSVGQRQLVSFVRAMVYNPKILVLDEATSSVDTETEETIQLAIEKMMKGRTSLVVAHRLSTIQKADRILVMEKGEIVEQGKHAELLALNGYYTQLYHMQSLTGQHEISVV